MLQDHEETLPQVQQATEVTELSAQEVKLAKIREKIVDVLSDSIDVIHAAVLGEDFRGKKVSRTQVFAANPILSRLGPQIEQSSSGAVHLHLNIPRPGKVKPTKVINVSAKDRPNESKKDA